MAMALAHHQALGSEAADRPELANFDVPQRIAQYGEALMAAHPPAALEYLAFATAAAGAFLSQCSLLRKLGAPPAEYSGQRARKRPAWSGRAQPGHPPAAALRRPHLLLRASGWTLSWRAPVVLGEPSKGVG